MTWNTTFETYTAFQLRAPESAQHATPPFHALVQLKTGRKTQILRFKNYKYIHQTSSISFKSTCDKAFRSAAPVSSIECRKRSN